jgi:hypothetical protein
MEKGRHSRKRESREFEKGKNISRARYFSMIRDAWMPACAGMTNYDTIFLGSDN